MSFFFYLRALAKLILRLGFLYFTAPWFSYSLRLSVGLEFYLIEHKILEALSFYFKFFRITLGLSAPRICTAPYLLRITSLH
jgi:hypothetical protein